MGAFQDSNLLVYLRNLSKEKVLFFFSVTFCCIHNNRINTINILKNILDILSILKHVCIYLVSCIIFNFLSRYLDSLIFGAGLFLGVALAY